MADCGLLFSNCFFQSAIWLACTSNFLTSSAIVKSPWIAARATLALNSGEWFRLFRLTASLQSLWLILEESTYLRPMTVQSGGSSSQQRRIVAPLWRLVGNGVLSGSTWATARADRQESALCRHPSVWRSQERKLLMQTRELSASH